MTIKIKNQNKRIHNIRRLQTSENRKTDIEDKYEVGPKKHWNCLKCGSPMEPYKQDEYGDIVMSCINNFCVNSKDWGGTLSIEMAKLTKEQQLHSRYYTSYLGDYYGLLYNRKREYNYQPKYLKI
jgi:hypothetical protein